MTTYDYQWLRMFNRLDPHSWEVTSAEGDLGKLSDPLIAKDFF